MISLAYISFKYQVPKSELTTNVDEVEVFMYQQMFVTLQDFADRNCKTKGGRAAGRDEDDDYRVIQMPIPLIFHAYFSEFARNRNHLVMENLRDQGYKPLRPETCGLVFMRAALSSLATVHASAYAYQHAVGGKSLTTMRYLKFCLIYYKLT